MDYWPANIHKVGEVLEWVGVNNKLRFIIYTFHYFNRFSKMRLLNRRLIHNLCLLSRHEKSDLYLLRFFQEVVRYG